jgi:benzoyl-CoA reductase/2-hydroxyglutaryl-CoA dehydratase subunit BcrC/BadD/HgdB
MKRKTKEYNMDWMLWSVFGAAAKLGNGTKKELDGLLKVVPSFYPLLSCAARFGKTGELLFKVADEYASNLMNARKEGKKIVLSTFLAGKDVFYGFDNLVPVWAEPMTALANIVFRQGSSEYYDYSCELGMTETSCAAQRGHVGAILAGLCEKPDFVVLGSCGPCDTNANAIQFYAEYEDVPLFLLDTPAKLVDEKVDAFHLKDMKTLVANIEEIVGEKINLNRLRANLQEKQKQDELINELLELTMLRPSPVPAIYHLFAYFAVIIMPGFKCTTDLYQAMVDDCKKLAAEGKAGTYSGKERTRLMMFYIEHYSIDVQFWDWVMANDMSLIPCIVYYWWQTGVPFGKDVPEESYRIDTSTLESCLQACADINSRRAMNKQMRGPYDAPTQWLDDCKAIAKYYKPDLLVYAGTMGCRNSWGVNKLMQRDMEKLGFPTLLIFADVFDPRVASWDAFKNQITEFIAVRNIPN